MSEHDDLTTIKILDHTYKVKCPPEQADALLKSAKYLDDKVRAMRKASPSANYDRLVAITALNIAHELLEGRQAELGVADGIQQQLDRIHERVKSTLGEER